MSQILRAFSATVDDVDNSDRTIVSKISVGSVDRYNSLILPRGIDLKAYVANPVVLFEHGKDVTRGNVPIGRNVWVKLNNQGNTLIAKTRFAKDEFSSTLYDFYRDGTMTGWSVRLLQKEQGGAPTREEVRSYPGMDKCDIVYRSTELAEYSATSVPGNSDCITAPELRSMFSEAQLESLSTLVVRGFWTPSEEVKPLLDPIIERMAESSAKDDGDASEAVEPTPEPEAAIEATADEGVTRSADEVETVEPEAAAESEPEAVSDVVRSVDEAVADAIADMAETVVDEVVERSAPEPEPAPEPVVVPEPEPVDPFAGLPPFVARSLEDVTRRNTAKIAAWHKSTAAMIRELEDYARGIA